MQDTICQCKHLCSLNIVFQSSGEEDYDSEKDYDEGDASSLLMEFSSALPNLATLQWEEKAPFYLDGNTWQCSPAFGARKAAKSPNGAGLRLLHAEKCTFEAVSQLPASLQTLPLCNRQDYCYPLLERLHKLLAPCAALCELYILHTANHKVLDLPAVAAACPALRVLVLHVLDHRPQTVSPSCTPACTFNTQDAVWDCLVPPDGWTMLVCRPLRLAQERLSCPGLRF